jgi:hypothetical protein
VLPGSLFAGGAVSYLLAIRFAPAPFAGSQPTPEAQLAAEQNARVTVTSAGAALAVAAGLLFTAFNYWLARRGHTAGQVTTALTQLGGTELYVRVGAIRALEALVRESRDDRLAILEVLASFVRHRAPHKPEPGPSMAYQPDRRRPRSHRVWQARESTASRPESAVPRDRPRPTVEYRADEGPRTGGDERDGRAPAARRTSYGG